MGGTISFSSAIAMKRRIKEHHVTQIIKKEILEESLNESYLQEYNTCKNELESIYYILKGKGTSLCYDQKPNLLKIMKNQHRTVLGKKITIIKINTYAH